MVGVGVMGAGGVQVWEIGGRGWSRWEVGGWSRWKGGGGGVKELGSHAQRGSNWSVRCPRGTIDPCPPTNSEVKRPPPPPWNTKPTPLSPPPPTIVHIIPTPLPHFVQTCTNYAPPPPTCHTVVQWIRSPPPPIISRNGGGGGGVGGWMMDHALKAAEYL